jgi:hypothetical protein
MYYTKNSEERRMLLIILMGLAKVTQFTIGDIKYDLDGYIKTFERSYPNVAITDKNQISLFGPGYDSTVKLTDLNLFLAEAIKRFKKLDISVELNDTYTAIVSSEGVRVGCVTFPLEVIDKLTEAKKQVLEKWKYYN